MRRKRPSAGQSSSAIVLSSGDRLDRSHARYFKRSATVFKISCESTSSDTARASDIAPTSALKVKIALDLAARLSLPGSNPTINSRSFLTSSEVSARVRFIAAGDLRPQSAECTARTWILAVYVAQVVVEKLGEG